MVFITVSPFYFVDMYYKERLDIFKDFQKKKVLKSINLEARLCGLSSQL